MYRCNVFLREVSLTLLSQVVCVFLFLQISGGKKKRKKKGLKVRACSLYVNNREEKCKGRNRCKGIWDSFSVSLTLHDMYF